MNDPSKRLDDIEQSLSHQARLTEQLNEVIYEHSRQIAAFEQVLKRLESRVKTLEQGNNSGDPGSTAEEASPWKDPEM